MADIIPHFTIAMISGQNIIFEKLGCKIFEERHENQMTKYMRNVGKVILL